MKKGLLSILFMFTLILLSACSEEDDKATESSNPTEKDNMQGVVEIEDAVVADEIVLAEPAEGEICAFCNMVVYAKDDVMGMFTTQGIAEDGETHFFDDVGCMLNYETQEAVELKKYVRDFDTKEWLAYGDATIVKSDMKTPMNYGYGFFKNKDDAEKFVLDNSADNAVLATSEEIAEVAQKMYEMKIEKMKSGESNHEEENTDKH